MKRILRFSLFLLILTFLLSGISFYPAVAKENIVTQTIILISPTGGEVCPAGGFGQIRWTTSVSSGYGVSIFYSVDGGAH